MKRIFTTSLCAAGILSCLLLTTSAQQPQESHVPSSPTLLVAESSSDTMSQLELDACQLINALRQEYHLNALSIRPDISAKARIKSQDMAELNYFSHTSPIYGSPFQMMKSLGLSYHAAGENIAKGYTTAQAAINGWMNSSTHRALLLSDRYTSMGLGYFDGHWTLWLLK